MREPEIILREIQDLDKISLNAQELSFQFPNDNLLRLNVEQAETRKRALLLEFEESLSYHRRHSIKYIFQNVQKIKLETLLNNLNSFKELIDRSFEKVTSGRKNNLPVYFNTVFSGSYGIQLSTPFEEKIIDPDFEKTIDKTLSVINDLVSSTEEQLTSILERDFGNERKLLNKYSLFFKKIYQADAEIRIDWKSPITNDLKSVVINPHRAKELHSIFSQKEVSEDTLELLGILKGLSLIRFKAEFVTDTEDQYTITARFDENLSEEVKDALDKYVTARFKVVTQYNEMQDQEERRYELISIYSNVEASH